jgi:Kef-type K+ transport system membrane component KefB
VLTSPQILAGIILGPTALGRIPGFTEHIFPAPSLPFLNLLATLGLILFLFVIGLEVDFGLFRRNLRPSLAVSIAGISIPFGLGCCIVNVFVLWREHD